MHFYFRDKTRDKFPRYSVFMTSTETIRVELSEAGSGKVLLSLAELISGVLVLVEIEALFYINLIWRDALLILHSRLSEKIVEDYRSTWINNNECGNKKSVKYCFLSRSFHGPWNVVKTVINFEKAHLGCSAMIGAGASRVTHFDLGHIRCPIR